MRIMKAEPTDEEGAPTPRTIFCCNNLSLLAGPFEITGDLMSKSDEYPEIGYLDFRVYQYILAVTDSNSTTQDTHYFAVACDDGHITQTSKAKFDVMNDPVTGIYYKKLQDLLPSICEFHDTRFLIDAYELHTMVNCGKNCTGLRRLEEDFYMDTRGEYLSQCKPCTDAARAKQTRYKAERAAARAQAAQDGADGDTTAQDDAGGDTASNSDTK